MLFNNKPATIVDVANEAHVSVATVSRVMSNSSYPVSAATRERVCEAAEKLGYSANYLGRMLKRQSSNTIAVIIPSFQNPYYTQLIIGIEQFLLKTDYSCYVVSSMRDPRIERTMIERLISLRVSGIILASVDDTPDALYRYLETGGRACVIEANYQVDERVVNVSTDIYAAGREAVEYLISAGHRSIALLTTPLVKQSRRALLDGCAAGCQQHGVPFSAKDDVYVVDFEQDLTEGLYEYEAGRMLVQILLSSARKYSAVLANNDLIACGIIRGLTDRGIRVPEDISVVGFDNVPQSVMVLPRLTTVDPGCEELSRKACELLIRKIEDEACVDMQSELIRPHLVVRESTMKV